MIYIYDVLLNFTDNFYYDFYEWTNKDNLVNSKKIPCIYVDKKVLSDLIHYKIKIDKKFLRDIDNKNVYLRKDKEKYNYSVIFSSREKSIGIVFDENGYIKYKSAMLPDEEDEANRLAQRQKLMTIKYKILDYNYNKIIRCDIEKKNIIIKKIKEDYKNKKYDKLRYIYYEIYDDTLDDIQVIYYKLISELDDNINRYNILFEIIK